MLEFNPGLDIFGSHADCIVNTVNCKGVMGKGLAAAFASRYPAILQPYKDACAAGQFQPGSVQLIRLDRVTGRRDPTGNFVIANVATKDDWRNPSRIEWIDMGAQKLARATQARGFRSIAIPRMGAGLGGLEWRPVHDAIVRNFAPLAGSGVHVIVIGDDLRPPSERPGGSLAEPGERKGASVPRSRPAPRRTGSER